MHLLLITSEWSLNGIHSCADCLESNLTTMCNLIYTPKPIFFYIYGWLIKIYGCFSAELENCGEGIFRLNFSAVYQIYG